MKRQELLGLVQEAFNKPAWHGPNLMGALRGVTVDEAIWQPEEGRHNIWEIVVHAAYWKYTVTNRLRGSKKHSFPEQGRNWFPRRRAALPESDLVKCWKSDLKLLARTHTELCQAIVDLKDADLMKPLRGRRQTAFRNLAGIAMHDIYHAGQIQILRRLYGRVR